jgi:acetylglutamate kinase
MQTMIEKAAVLIEALPFIQAFRGEAVVVKFGGSIMDETKLVDAILRDIAFMECIGLRPVLVHGGGKAITRRLQERGVHSEFRQGLRVTGEDAIREVEQVLNHEVNPHIVKKLVATGCKARGIHGEDIISAEKKIAVDGDGNQTDWGHVGRAVAVDPEPIQAYLSAGIVPVVTPLGQDEDRQLYNINADEAATLIAREIKARKLVFLSDVPGLLKNESDRSDVISTLKTSEVDELIRRKVISGGMLPKIQGAVDAIRAGVQKTHIIDAALPHSLLLELFTEQGVGTEIVL